MPAKKTVVMSVRLPAEVVWAIKQLAGQSDMTTNEIIKTMLAEGVQRARVVTVTKKLITTVEVE